VFDAVKFTAAEIRCLQAIPSEALVTAEERAKEEIPNSRERAEFVAKLKKLGVQE
jgi:hypothetical protein